MASDPDLKQFPDREALAVKLGQFDPLIQRELVVALPMQHPKLVLHFVENSGTQFVKREEFARRQSHPAALRTLGPAFAG